jgi:phage shock protein E
MNFNSTGAGQDNALIIDVRTLKEWNQGHLASAQHIPLQDIAKQSTTLFPEKGQKIYLYCRSGNRSGKAKTILQQLGYRNVVNAGGLNAASKLLEDGIIAN